MDLEYLIHRTKSNPVLMMEMISAYLEQTPRLIGTMKQSFKDHDWNMLYASVHKMIPSFSIMGMSIDFENMAKKVQEFASTQKQADGINDLVLQLGNVCTMACEESVTVRMLSDDTGSEKLGQPVPESNFLSDKNRSVPQQTHR